MKNEEETHADHVIYIVVKSIMMAIGIIIACFIVGTYLGMRVEDKVLLMVAMVLIVLPLIHRW